MSDNHYTVYLKSRNENKQYKVQDSSESKDVHDWISYSV